MTQSFFRLPDRTSKFKTNLSEATFYLPRAIGQPLMWSPGLCLDTVEIGINKERNHVFAVRTDIQNVSKIHVLKDYFMSKYRCTILTFKIKEFLKNLYT